MRQQRLSLRVAGGFVFFSQACSRVRCHAATSRVRLVRRPSSNPRAGLLRWISWSVSAAISLSGASGLRTHGALPILAACLLTRARHAATSAHPRTSETDDGLAGRSRRRLEWTGRTRRAFTRTRSRTKSDEVLASRIRASSSSRGRCSAPSGAKRSASHGGDLNRTGEADPISTPFAELVPGYRAGDRYDLSGTCAVRTSTSTGVRMATANAVMAALSRLADDDLDAASENRNRQDLCRFLSSIRLEDRRRRLERVASRRRHRGRLRRGLDCDCTSTRATSRRMNLHQAWPAP